MFFTMSFSERPDSTCRIIPQGPRESLWQFICLLSFFFCNRRTTLHPSVETTVNKTTKETPPSPSPTNHKHLPPSPPPPLENDASLFYPYRPRPIDLKLSGKRSLRVMKKRKVHMEWECSMCDNSASLRHQLLLLSSLLTLPACSLLLPFSFIFPPSTFSFSLLNQLLLNPLIPTTPLFLIALPPTYSLIQKKKTRHTNLL